MNFYEDLHENQENEHLQNVNKYDNNKLDDLDFAFNNLNQLLDKNKNVSTS